MPEELNKARDRARVRLQTTDNGLEFSAVAMRAVQICFGSTATNSTRKKTGLEKIMTKTELSL